MSVKTEKSLNLGMQLNSDILFPIVVAIIVAAMWAYPVWSPISVLFAFTASFMVSCGIFYGMLYACVPKEGMSNNTVGLFVFSLVGIFAMLLLLVGSAIGKLHGWL